MIAEIKPSAASGSITVPTSKSMAHRLLIAAAMCEGGKSVIHGVTESNDVLATVSCLSALGAKISTDGEGNYTVIGTDMRKTAPSGTLFCNESGSTLRFIIPIATLSGARTHISGAKRLLERPLTVYEEIYRERELLFERIGDIIFVDGPLPSGEYTVRGDVSSQFISGLLLALPTLDEDSVIKIIPPFESRPYVNMTIAALNRFGIHADFTDEYTIKIAGGQRYTACDDITVEGDFSGAAFIDALGVLGSRVKLLGLPEKSAQADSVYRELFEALGSGSPTVDITDCPDLAPVLFALAAYLNGATFIGTSRLKIKESDRAEAMAEELKRLGASVTVGENSVTVNKSLLHAPSEPISSHNDHRIVMAMAVLLTKLGGKIIGAEAVKKSYPNFFSDLQRLGIEVKLYD